MLRNALYFMALCVLSTALAVVAGCEGETTFSNNPPSGLTIEVSECTIPPGGSVDLTGAAEDLDGDLIEYRWAANAGSFDPGDAHGATVGWTAPIEPGTYTITLYATDGINEQAHSTEVDVAEPFPNKPTGLVRIANEGNTYIITDPVPVEIGTATTVVLEAGVDVVVASETGGLDILGTLIVEGTESDPVSIGPSGCPGEEATWGGLEFDGADARGDIAHLNLYGSDYGVTATGQAEVFMDSSSVFDAAGHGISLSDLATAVLRDVTIWDNGTGGVQAINSHLTLENCSIRYNRGAGVSLSGTTAYSITGCLIASNAGDGVTMVSDAAPVINGCTFFFNEPADGTGYAIRLLFPYAATDSVDARGNYWGATTAGEIAEKIYDKADDAGLGAYVDFGNWLSQEPLAVEATRRGR